MHYGPCLIFYSYLEHSHDAPVGFYPLAWHILDVSCCWELLSPDLWRDCWGPTSIWVDFLRCVFLSWISDNFRKDNAPSTRQNNNLMCSGPNPATNASMNIYILSDAASKSIIIESTQPNSTHNSLYLFPHPNTWGVLHFIFSARSSCELALLVDWNIKIIRSIW